MKKIIAFSLLLLIFPLIAVAQEDDNQEVYLPNLGLTLIYPPTWSALPNPNFDIILVENPDDEQSGFVGVQSNNLPPEETLESLMAGLAEQFGGEAESADLNGVEAWQFEVSNDVAEVPSTIRVIGFEPSPDYVALLIASSPSEQWEAFIPNAETVLTSLVITPLELDTTSLDEQFLASFENEQILRLGDADAPVAVVEVLDFSCGHCANYSLSVKRLIQDYVNSGKIQLEFRFATFVGQDLSQLATHAQYCAASQGFGWQMHTALFDIHLQEGPQNFTADNINSVVRTFEGVDAEAFETCLTDQPFADLLTRDSDYLGEAGVDGTPSILVGVGDESPTFLIGDSGSPLGGGVALQVLYNRLDELVAE